jgi:hypothetical protein
MKRSSSWLILVAMLFTVSVLAAANCWRTKKINKNRFPNREKCRYNLTKEQFIPPNPQPMATACKHPKVRIVSRHDDTEFVECQDCGEVFDSEEFRDMEIEETAETEPGLEVS